jgi:ABC-type nitrate/sulfonate/bicarbonate transport system permease component
MNPVKIYENRSIGFKNLMPVFLAVIFVYVLLFEFVLPVNKILPRPSLLIESVSALVTDYGLFAGFTVTTTIIYLSLIISYLTLIFIAPLLIKIYYEYPGVFNLPRIFRYFPAFFLAILFNYWFNQSIIAEFIFIYLASLSYLGLVLYGEIPNVKREYIDTALSLKMSQKKIYSKVLWKSCQPEVFNSLHKIHYYVWILILIYEFIGNANGLGNIYSFAYLYNDLAAMVTLAIIISLLVWLGNSIIKYFSEKLIYWKP